MLAEPRVTYEGKHLSVRDTINYPRPVQRPRPPLMIGGGGERYTLRLAARYADMYNTWGGSPETVRHKFEVLRRHCEEIGRPYDEITRSNHVTMLIARDERELAAKKERYTWFRSQPPLIGTPETIIAGIREYAAAGSQYLIFDLVDWHDPESTYLFADAVMPVVRGL
jgi:alkanesulfonate monooxygenase SsuD/methylene tetrahydromethanopterin reductase-like flavin-dependent oxidoreductase (luciferase family)